MHSFNTTVTLKETIGVFTDGQGGGRPGRTCGQKAQIILNAMSFGIRNGINLAVLKFDVVKAYDKVQKFRVSGKVSPRHSSMMQD